MSIQKIDFAGWSNSLLLSNGQIEAVVTTDVGPRVISLKVPGGENVFKNYAEQMGGSGESGWMIRGGHRHWIAPEDEKLTYLTDNDPVSHELVGDSGVRLTNPPVAPWNLRKETTVALIAGKPGIEVTHTIINDGSAPIRIAPWALTVMAPGGLEILPLPLMGEHPRDLLPNRLMVLWPYTNLADPRLKMGRRFIFLKQSADLGPTKLGFRHTEGWAGYLLGNNLFLKSVPDDASATYADMGCNFETFTNQDMLESETLGAYAELASGASVTHIERWHLAGGVQAPSIEDEDAFAAWIQPYVKAAGF